MKKLITKTENGFPDRLERMLPYKEGMEIFQALYNWSQQWSIYEWWMIEDGWIAFLSWLQNPELRREWYWYDNYYEFSQAIARASTAQKRMEMDPDFPPKFNPLIHGNKKQFSQQNIQANKEINKLLLAKYGLKRTVKKDQRHFEWLVKKRMLGLNEDQILQLMIEEEGEERYIQTESIKKAINETAKLVGFKS